MSSPTESLQHRTLVGIFWSSLGNYGASAVRFVSILALGWLLTEEDFGLLALAMIFLSFAEGVGQMGMTSALVQMKTIDRRSLDSAFWPSLAFHLLLAGTTFFLAEPITGFFGDSRAAPLLRLFSPVFLIGAMAVVPRALLIREMRFRQVSMAQLAGEFGFAVVGLTMAGLGYGTWALAGAVLAQRCLNAAYLWQAGRYWPGFSADLETLTGLLRFGAPVALASVVDRGLARADYFVVGRFIGTEALGYYSLALQLAFLPLQKLIGAVHRVAFPAFSIVQDDLQRLKSGLLRGVRHLLAVVLLAVLYVVILGPWLLEGIYAEKWAPSIVPLRILGVTGFFWAARLFEASLLAVGRAQLQLWLSLLRLGVFALLVALAGLEYGINGVAASVAAAQGVWAAIFLVIAMRSFGIQAREVGSASWPAVRAAAGAMAPLVLFLFLPGTLSPWTSLVAAGGVMTAVYLLLIAPLYREPLAARWRALRG